MPQIDLRQAFSPPNQQGDSSVPDSADQLNQPESGNLSFKTIAAEKFAIVTRLGGPGWVNLLFVTVTFLGGLFCALYFFNSVESLRAAAARAREFIYPRPADAEQANPDLFKVGKGELPPTENYRASREPTGNPFWRTPGLFGPNPSFPRASFAGTNVNSPSGGSIPSPTSLLSQLDALPSGGDALVQSLFQGAARTADIDARRTVVVVTTPVAQAPQAVSNGAKSATKQISNGVTKSTIPASKLTGGSTVKNSSPNSTVSGATQHSAAAISRSANQFGGQAMGAGRGVISSGMSGIRSGGGRMSSGGGRRR